MKPGRKPRTPPRRHPFVELLWRTRREREITQEQLAEKLNVGRKTIPAWESGQQIPSLVRFEKWAAALGYEVVVRLDLHITIGVQK